MSNNQTMNHSDPLEELLPSLFQCFSIILIGYLAVRLSLIKSETTTLGTYVTKFALPALFFRSMATMNLNDVNWFFILAVFLAKFIFWTFTVLVTIIVTKPMNIGMAGILSMFVTQSNDVALGYPILLGLYPDLAKYIYLFAPTQLVFINPLCFILLEWHEYRQNETGIQAPMYRCILLVLKNVLLNPLVYMTVIGIIFNVILSHRLPLIIDKPLQILSDSFSGVALFYLGMNMVDKLNNITKKGIYILVSILLGKLIFLPFITRELVVHLVSFTSNANQTLNYSLMGFLYGGLPTAPPVFLIANDFRMIPDVIATGLVVGTFLSGPLMFITGRVITMTVASKYEYNNILQSTAISTSTLSICGCVWVLLLFLFSRRLRCPVHRVTICYCVCVLLSTLGLVIGRIILPNNINSENAVAGWGDYFQFSVFFIGTTGARLWTSLIALSLAIIKRKSVCTLINNLKYFYLFGFCIPVIITSGILIFGKKQKTIDIDPSFQYGQSQVICSFTVLAFSIVTTVIALVLQVRHNFFDLISPNTLSSSDINSTNRVDDIQQILDNDTDLSRKTCSNCVICPHNEPCQLYLTSYRDYLSPHERSMFYSDNDEEFQIHRHTVLVILLLVTMGFGFFLCLWRLIKEEMSGIYIELEFLDCVFNFGQGFIIWAIFGLNSKLIVNPFKKSFNTIRKRLNRLCMPKMKNLSAEVIEIKNSFCDYHLIKCRNEISKDISEYEYNTNSSNLMIQGFKLYQNVFTGSQLITWILNANLEDCRTKAHTYGQALLTCGIIENVTKNYNLIYDDENLYQFITDKSDSIKESDLSASSSN